MATRNHLNMLSGMENGVQAPTGNLEDSLQTELQLLMQHQHNQNTLGRERDFNTFRSGSAPPTVEGSLNAMGSLFGNSDFGEITGTASCNDGILSEDEICSHPAYLSYYYSQCNNNPRMPPPLLSREDWRVAQRFQASGSNGDIGDWGRKKMVHGGDSLSLFSTQPGLSVQRAENDLMELRNLSRKTSLDWVDGGSDGLIGLSNSGIGSRRKSFADIVQEGLDQSGSFSGLPPRPSSCNAFGDLVNISVADPHPTGLSNGLASTETLHNGVAPHGLSEAQRRGTRSSSFASTGSSLSRSPTPEQKIVGKSHGLGLPPVGSRICHVEKNVLGPNIQNDHSSGKAELADITSNLSSLRLPKYMQQDVHDHAQSQLHMEPDLQLNNSQYQNLLQGLVYKDISQNLSLGSHYADVARKNDIATHLNVSKLSSNGLVNFPKRTSSYANLYSRPSLSGHGSLEESNVYHHNASTSGLDFVSGAYSINQMPKTGTALRKLVDAGDRQSPNALGNRIGSGLHSPVADPLHSQFLPSPNRVSSSLVSPIDSSLPKNQYGILHGRFEGLPEAYLEALLSQQREQLELSLVGRSGGNCESYGNLSFRGGKVPHPGNPQADSLLNYVRSGTHLFHNERVSQFNSLMRSSMGGAVGSWHTDNCNNTEGRLVSFLLDEFKNNKTKSFELSDIVDHVVEFSMDQYGSRFIQQKLEIAAVEEKAKIFPEIIQHARILMTDVFGNYVIQKFFEHGTESQRRELAHQLTGHVLPLSLQMYGCRVIQKALEVVDVDQQTQMVSELDGSVMKCIRDQNGNHVIQKSIECVPQDRIQFIISSFYGQVVVLSTHPYGCRVIQRVLEYSNDANTQQIIMKEIMQSVCTLAQDQYGNYVIQHILEHGKPEERSTIISNFTGQIVRMSQHKFASNVVEKCLTFASSEERQLLVNEMLGSTDENEPLQAMMKDPFGNYVVQKVLETCNNQSLEFILSRIKVHLNTLKRFTYGKHIVSRIEKLITTGERRINLSSACSSSKLPN